jgi:pterin-4a-carbinolamine dehydratase
LAPLGDSEVPKGFAKKGDAIDIKEYDDPTFRTRHSERHLPRTHRKSERFAGFIPLSRQLSEAFTQGKAFRFANRPLELKTTLRYERFSQSIGFARNRLASRPTLAEHGTESTLSWPDLTRRLDTIQAFAGFPRFAIHLEA